MISPTRRKLFVLLLCAGLPAVSLSAYGSGQFIDIYPKTEQDIQVILDTLEASINTPAADPDTPPILMMLHGPQAQRFLRSTYAQNKALIDQTAKLAAYGVLEVKICATWLRKNNYSAVELFPFVSSVPYGAGELARLQEEEDYTEFSIDL